MYPISVAGRGRQGDKRNYFRIPFRVALDGQPGSAIRLSGNSGQGAPAENSKLWRTVILRLSGVPLPPFLYLILETKELSKIRAGDL